jgi:butyryl-CoA dehydrogenase
LVLCVANAAFSHELRMLAGAKKITLAAINNVVTAHGDRARDEQELLGLMAEMVMDVYALESAVLRTQRLIIERGLERSAIPIEITRVFARDGAARVERAGRMIATETNTEEDKGADLIDRLTHHAPIKTVQARRRIADSMIAAGKYNL